MLRETRSFEYLLGRHFERKRLQVISWETAGVRSFELCWNCESVRAPPAVTLE